MEEFLQVQEESGQGKSLELTAGEGTWGKRRRMEVRSHLHFIFPYRHKLLKWWAQSFLLGVPNVVAGFRNPEGFVCSLKTFPTMQMFEHVRVRQWCHSPEAKTTGPVSRAACACPSPDSRPHSSLPPPLPSPE